MWRTSPKARIARRFLDALCAGEAATVDALMTEDVAYTDGRGNRLDGFAACSAGARRFHELEPSYRFRVDETTVRGETVMFRGVSTASNPQLTGELLIHARLRGDKICAWEIYRHNAPALARILARDAD